MSAISLVTKGMICQGIGASIKGTYGRPSFSDTMIDHPIIHVKKIKTKVIDSGMNLDTLSDISVKVGDVVTKKIGIDLDNNNILVKVDDLIMEKIGTNTDELSNILVKVDEVISSY